ncbi:MAG TPA: adenylate/guanylate cyclase domain-containing protein [Candidatus Binatia bacterium]|nr:adenylate/guanylate cyclase domain-containing protein [Candidatus Binatia bacterium]
MDSTPTTAPRRHLAAILSADAVGYSARMAEDPAATVEALRARRQTFAGYIRKHQGRLVGTAGDNVLAEFASAIDAAACALDVQGELARIESSLPHERRLPFRIGVHLGEILIDEGEIFGDGINVAARLEGLSFPGGICASAAVVEQVRGKVEGVFEDIGEQYLKNIPAPVRAYRISPAGGEGELAAHATVAGFSGRPVIAILPFDDRAADPAYGYLADGIVEDLIAHLSAFRLFPVISRSSTFSYKGRRVDPRQVSRELRARYIVEGSVQAAAGRVRVKVDLIDGVQGHQVWSERFDRELVDVFALQDEIVLAVVSSIEPALGRAERQRIQSKPAPQLDAWECFQRGSALLFALRSREELEEALALLRRARQLDRGFSTAAALETVCLVATIMSHWSSDPSRVATEAGEAARAAVALDENDPWAQAALGFACSMAEDQERSIAAFERAIELNPSLTMAYQGLAVALTVDHPDEAIAVMEKAIRLSPRDSQMHLFLHQLAAAHLMAGRYEDAIRHETESLRLRPDQGRGYRILAAACGHAGRCAEALQALEKMDRLAPGFSFETFRQTNSEALVETCVSGWRKAGWQG